MNTREWVFRYPPTTFDTIILNPDVRSKLKKVFYEMPTFMLAGKPGVGKGTFTNVFLKETKVDYIKINCSDETGIDNIRTKVKSFATALGTGEIKYVVLNEADFLTIQSQAMLRDLIEQVEMITRFIFQCNYVHKIIPELLSRCQVIELNNPPAVDIYKHCQFILDSENVKCDKNTLVKVIKNLYPDIRRIINTLQLNNVDGVIKSVSIESSDNLYKNILSFIKEKDIELVRKELRSSMIDYSDLYNYLYENVGEFKNPGDMIILISEHLYRDFSVSIKEINFIGMIVKALKGGFI